MATLAFISCQDQEYCFECTVTTEKSVHTFEVCKATYQEITGYEQAGTYRTDSLTYITKCKLKTQ